ncbi:lantibiotic dehydratase [Embleya scabrispora]|uniref:lantibiotic dehydratase n=1 Tax=Embleya scabrispora TaxID=159449 RepID=UPI000399AD63|nr:lantibiotic dehydratase [Embleya scabrispora]
MRHSERNPGHVDGPYTGRDDARDNQYEPAGPVFVRMASVPRGGTDPGPARAAPVPDTADAHTAEGLRRIIADPLLREAVRVASGSLSAALDRLDAGADLGPKRLTGTALSVTRYALRMGGRPTPFGLFAGVTTAHLGTSARARVHGPGTKAVRLDAGRLDERVRAWLAAPEVRRRVDVVLNDLCRVRGDRLVLSGPEREISVRHSPLVAHIRAAAPHPVPYRTLLDRAAEAFPGAPRDRLDASVAQLLQHGFLLSSITPHRLDEALLDRIEAAVEELPAVAAEVRATRAAVREYEKARPGEGTESWHRLMALVDPRADAVRPPVQVDLRMDAELTLPRAVGEEASAYADAMWTLSDAWVTHEHMRDYRNRFIERYGTTRTVPLAELVDPHRGLGFPTGYGERLAPGEQPTTGYRPGRDRRVLIAELVQEALLREDRELRLTPDLIELLAGTAQSEGGEAAAPPNSLDLCFQLLASDAAALDQGRFKLVGTAHAGSWVAGSMAGRFAELTDSGDTLAKLVAAAADVDAVPAQISFRPHTARALNMIQVPRLLSHEIPVGVYTDRRDPHSLDWRELLVGVDPAGLKLILPRTGQRVMPVVPHMLALDREAPKVVRLMVDIVFGRSRTWTGWDWTGLEALPLLPRVTFGRVVVAPKRWTPDRAMYAGAEDPPEFDRALREWSDRYGVPDRVQVVHWDRVYGLDLATPWHRTLLRHEVRRGRVALLEDPSEDGRGFGWADGHSTEVVVPLTRRAAARALPTTAPVAPEPAAGPATGYHLPGEDWLFAKLYATPDTHDELLRVHLPALLADVGEHVDRWFFIRYLDPDPHIRIRLHGDPASLRNRVLPELARHVRAMRGAGAIRTMALDVYEPETQRYGGPNGPAAAERLFTLDSRSAIAQLGLRARGALAVPDEVLIAVNHALLLESLGDWDWPSWVEYAFVKDPDQSAFRRHRALVRDLIRPGHTAAAVGERLGVPALARLWTRPEYGRAYGATVLSDAGRRPAGAAHENAVLGLLHMQHNRLIGIDRASEQRGYAILRGIASDHLGRLAHAPGRSGAAGSGADRTGAKTATGDPVTAEPVAAEAANDQERDERND